MKLRFIGAATCAAIVVAMSSGARADLDTQGSPHTQSDVNAMDSAQRTSATAPKGPHMSSAMSVAMKAVFTAAGAKDWPTAKARLDDARKLPDPTDFDQFELEVGTGYVALNTGDKAGAFAAYKKVIGSQFFTKGLSPQDQSGTLRNGIVLANAAQDYPTAISFGQKLAANGAMDENSAIAVATAYFGNKNYAAARDLAQKAIDAETSSGGKPNETAQKIVEQSKASLAAN